jgi:hypothetical protein
MCRRISNLSPAKALYEVLMRRDDRAVHSRQQPGAAALRIMHRAFVGALQHAILEET